jgi:hypothetical protein
MARLLPRKRRWRILLALAAVLAVAWFVAPQLLVPTIERKLQAMIGSQLKADLSIGAIRYAPPYGVRVRDVSLLANDPKHGRVEILKVAVLDLKLAKLPVGDGPLVIENVTIRDPALHVVIADGQVVGRGGVVRPEGERRKTLDELLPPGTRLSDMFRLRHFGLHGGTVLVENRDRPGSAPMVWRALDAEMQTAPRSKSTYDFSLGTDPGGPADLSANGSFDLDELWAQVDRFHLAVRADDIAADRSALPAEVQAVLRKYDVKGRVTLDAAGRVPLRDPSAGHFSGAIELAGASAAVPAQRARLDRLDARVTFAREPSPTGGDPGAGGASGPPRPTVVRLERFSGASGPMRLTASLGAGVIDHQRKTWTLRDLRAGLAFEPRAPVAAPSTQPSFLGPIGSSGAASARLTCGGRLGAPLAAGGIDVEAMTLDVQANDLTVQPPRFEAPLRGLTATVRKPAGSRVAVVSGGSCRYGNDRISVTSARLPIPTDPLTMIEAMRFEEIVGSMQFHPPRAAAYPGGFGRVVNRLGPGGTFLVGGGSWYGFARYDLDPATTLPSTKLSRRKGDYFFSVSADSARFDLLDGRLPLTGLHGDGTFSPMATRAQRVRANLYGGTVSGTFRVTPGKPAAFDGNASLDGVQLKQIGEAFDLEARHRDRLAGKAYLNVSYSGRFPVKGSDDWLDTLRAEGQFEVFGGRFWTLPVLGHVAERTRQASHLTVGEAAGWFDVRGRRIELRNAAVQSAALGVLGSGTIGFDKSLDLKLIAAPLGDWRDRLKRGRIPILSDVAAEVFGAIQQLLNTATSTLLYEFRVKGTLRQPKVEAVPAPVLTEPAGVLLGQMMRDVEGKDRGKWSEMAKKKQ